MPCTENYRGADRTAGNIVAIQPMLRDFSEEIIVISIIAAEKVRRVWRKYTQFLFSEYVWTSVQPERYHLNLQTSPDL